MSKKIKYSGLCSTCRYASCCINLKSSKSTIWECELFEIFLYKPVKEESTAINNEENDCAGYTGLCKNCENRKTCRCSTSEGGIWHCEEYL